MADNEPVIIQNVLSVIWKKLIDEAGGVGQFILLGGDGDALENTVISTADLVLLILGEVAVLGHTGIVYIHLSGDAVYRSQDIAGRDPHGRLGYDVAVAMADQHLNRDLRIILEGIRQVYDRAGDTVGYFVRVGRVHFFVHSFILSWRGEAAP